MCRREKWSYQTQIRFSRPQPLCESSDITSLLLFSPLLHLVCLVALLVMQLVRVEQFASNRTFTSLTLWIIDHIIFGILIP